MAVQIAMPVVTEVSARKSTSDTTASETHVVFTRLAI